MQIIELEVVPRDEIEPSTRGFPGFEQTFHYASILPERSMKPRRAPPVMFAVTILCGGCALTPAPLETDHGYPADWPPPIALSKGLTELNGIYVNQGVATTVDGKLVPIALADLVPRTTPRKHASADLDSGCEDCVALRVLPARSDSLSTLRLRFTLPPGSDRPSSPHEFEVASSGNANATQYTLQGFADNAIIGFGFNATDVTVTCATDRSLIARIHNTSGVLVFLVIPISSENYTWARFERIGE